MSSADFQAEGSAAHAGNTNANSMGERVGDAYSQASTLARDAGEKVKQAASETASTVTDQVKELLDRQIGTGANMAGQFASSARLAANDLDQQAPLLAGLVRNFANKVETLFGRSAGPDGGSARPSSVRLHAPAAHLGLRLGGARRVPDVSDGQEHERGFLSAASAGPSGRNG
jgi:hypothetical protein